MLQNYYNDSKHIPCNTFVISIALICIMCLPYLHHVFMKTRKLLLLLALAAATTGMQAQRIKGSDTVLPIAQQTAERFMTLTPSARVTVTGGGTGVGISALLDQTTDIAMASRAIKFSEKMKAKAAGEDLAEVPIAYDALAVVVHPSNLVKQLTRQQLEDIFGQSHQLAASGRRRPQNRSLLPRDFLRYLRVLQGKRTENKNYMSSSLSMPATGAIIQSVSQTRGAIGYVGLAYVSPRIKTLAVSYDGQHYAAPTLENAINKTYPIVRPLYYYYNRKNASVVAPLLDFILSAAGQKIIKESGYIPVHKE